LNSCSGNGVCYSFGTFEQPQFRCTCDLNYYGDDCSFYSEVCNSVPCGAFGTCVPNQQNANDFTCICDSTHTGTFCQDETDPETIDSDSVSTPTYDTPTIDSRLSDTDAATATESSSSDSSWWTWWRITLIAVFGSILLCFFGYLLWLLCVAIYNKYNGSYDINKQD